MAPWQEEMLGVAPRRRGRRCWEWHRVAVAGDAGSGTLRVAPAQWSDVPWVHAARVQGGVAGGMLDVARLRMRFADTRGGAGQHGQALVVAIGVEYTVHDGLHLAQDPARRREG